MRTPFLIFPLFFLFLTSVFAAEETEKPYTFTTSVQTIGPVTLKLAELDFIRELNQVQTLTAKVSNDSDVAIPAEVELTSCDSITPVVNGQNAPKATRKVEIPAKGSVDVAFQFQALDGTYSAYYPLNVVCRFTEAGKAREAEAVRVIHVKLPKSALKPAEEAVVKIGGVSLIGKKYDAYRSFDGKIISMPNFDGRDAEVHTNWIPATYETGGDARPCFVSHPPYVPKAEALFVDYPVHLSNEPGLTLSFGACIRKPTPSEPVSDGVTFRVWGRLEEAGAFTDAPRELLDEIHTDSKTWVDRVVSLEKYAGKKVRLTIEIHPGPKNNSVCDGCYVSGLVINSARVKSYAASQPKAASQTVELKLDAESVARVTPGEKGLFDAQFAIGNPAKPDSFVTFSGLNLAIGTQSLTAPGAVFTKLPELTRSTDGKLVFSGMLLLNDEEFPFQLFVYAKNGMLVFEVPSENPVEIRGFSLKPADRKIQRVYWGHGFVAENPGAFRIGMGGHDLAASHVGADFENGTSLVLGASCAPVCFLCDGEKNQFSLEMNSAFRLAVVPCYSGGAFNAAIKYRKQNDWLPRTAPGVERKRGRLTFDVWGGSYKKEAADVRKAIQYGVRDALYIKHVWQAWGYDTRLPDVWNPNDPENPNWGAKGATFTPNNQGTMAELRDLCETCTSHGIAFGLHDNYIDIYPDAHGFSYDCVMFNADGSPRTAWYSFNRQNASYKFRADSFIPFLKKNLEYGRKFLPTMDAYFLDVFTAANIPEYYDRNGKFHPMPESAAYYAECFRLISSELSHTVNGANGQKKVLDGITTSESGDDALLGSISGGDCQWMLISPKKGAVWCRHLPCENWSRTPWFAAVNHTNFSRHGAGYADRYVGVRDFALHHVLSDDYISAEVLGGLDPMVIAGQVFDGAVRKYYFTQHVARLLADQEIERVDFAADENGKWNLRRQCVTWSNGVKIFANRGDGVWTVAEYQIPKYGFVVLDAQQKFLAGIVCNSANPREVVQLSVRPDRTFCLDGRGKAAANYLPIQPTMKSARVLEDGRAFEVATNWHCEGPAPKKMNIFAHVYEPYTGYFGRPTGWMDGYDCEIPTDQWGTSDATREIVTSKVFRIPEGTKDGKFFVMVGLCDPAGPGNRAALMGENAQQNRYSVAELNIRDGKVVGEIKAVELTETMNDFRRLLGNHTPLEFNGISTLGMLAVTPTDAGFNLLPLPAGLQEFDVHFARLPKRVTCDGVEVPVKDGTFRVKVEDAKVYGVEFQENTD